jgi:hypothetical protein
MTGIEHRVLTSVQIHNTLKNITGLLYPLKRSK